MVGPSRDDERFSAEGVYLYDDSITTPEQAREALAARYGITDELAPADVVQVQENRWRPGEKCWRLWWD